jgi:uncharacterized integral membrane protein
MPWRLIGLIVILAVLLAFIGFNLSNTCSISFGVATLENVPVYLTVFASFVLGMLVSLPFLISFTLKRRGPKTPKASASNSKRMKTELPPESFDRSGKGPSGLD